SLTGLDAADTSSDQAPAGPTRDTRSVTVTPPRLTPAQRVRRAAGDLVRQPTLLLALLVLATVLVATWFPGLFTSYDPIKETGERLTAPNSEHWFGTDEQGRDLFARVVHGTSQSVLAVVVAVLVGLVVGSMIG